MDHIIAYDDEINEKNDIEYCQNYKYNPYFTSNSQICRTLRPTVTGSSCVALRFNHGIVVASDTLASYGNMSRFPSVCKIIKLGSRVLMCSSGEISDFQKLSNILNEEVKKNWLYHDKHEFDAENYTNFVSRIAYGSRNNFNPFWLSNIICGYIKDKKSDINGTNRTITDFYQTNGDIMKPYIGYVDMYGTIFNDDCVATGFGRHLALSLLRTCDFDQLTESEAREKVKKCMQVLYSRDTLASKMVQFAIVKMDEITIEKPEIIDAKWDYIDYTKPTISMSLVGSSW